MEVCVKGVRLCPSLWEGCSNMCMLGKGVGGCWSVEVYVKGVRFCPSQWEGCSGLCMLGRGVRSYGKGVGGCLDSWVA